MGFTTPCSRPGIGPGSWQARERPRWPWARPAKTRSYTVAHVPTCRSGCGLRDCGAERCSPSPADSWSFELDSSSLPDGPGAQHVDDAAREGPGAVRLRARAPCRPTGPGEALRRRAQGREPARLDAAARRAAAPRRLALRTRRTPSSWPACSARGATDRHRASSRCSSRRRRCAMLEMVAPTRFSGLADRAAAAARTPPPARPRSSSRPTTPTRSTATSPRELVYVNYGVPEDYEELERRGIDVKGKIVIARYGGSWRGIKPKVAAEHGAIGCLIYSDPREDGYFQGDVYPRAAGATTAARAARLGGGHADLSGRPADARRRRHRGRQAARRQGRDDADQDPRAADLLRRRPAAAQGARRPDGARGLARRAAAPLPPRPRPGPRPPQAGSSTGTWRPIYDVIATLPGAERPDEWVDPRQPPRRAG